MPVWLYFRAFCAGKGSSYQGYLGNISGWKDLRHLLGDSSQSQLQQHLCPSVTLLLMSVGTKSPSEPSTSLHWLHPMCLCHVQWDWGLQCNPKAQGFHVSSQLCRRASKLLTFHSCQNSIFTHFFFFFWMKKTILLIILFLNANFRNSRAAFCLQLQLIRSLPDHACCGVA